MGEHEVEGEFRHGLDRIKQIVEAQNGLKKYEHQERRDIVDREEPVHKVGIPSSDVRGCGHSAMVSSGQS